MESDLAFWILRLARALAIVVAFAAFAWALRRMRRESAEQLETLIAAAAAGGADIQALSERRHRAGHAGRRSFRRASSPGGSPAASAAAPRREASPVRSYETARRLARSGATVEEIVATCGVAGTEARLLRRLHGGAAERDQRRLKKTKPGAVKRVSSTTPAPLPKQKRLLQGDRLTVNDRRVS